MNLGQLVLGLVPLALGIVLSPLAIMALVAVLLSARARVNGVMYLIGWALAIAVALALSYSLLGSLGVGRPDTPPVWVSVLKVVLGLVLMVGGVWEYRKGRAKIKEMAAASTPDEVVAAAPQLPGWLKAVETFTASRSLLLGFGIFILNPVDLSCAVIAGIDIRAAGLPTATTTAVLLIFGIVGLLPIAIPVFLMLIMGDRADPMLQRTRTYIGSHSGVLNAGLLLVIGALQLQKGLSVLIG